MDSPPQSTFEFISPEEFSGRLAKLWKMENKDYTEDESCDADEDNDDDCPMGQANQRAEEEETTISLSILSHISFFFCVITHLSSRWSQNNLASQVQLLILIRQYIEVLYCIESRCFDIDLYSPNELLFFYGTKDISNPTLDEYIDLHFPGASPSITGNILIRCGEFWFIRYNDALKMVKDKKGMDILEYLLSMSGRRIPFSELYIATNKPPTKCQLTETPNNDAEHTDEDDMVISKLFSETDLSKDDVIPIHEITPPSREKISGFGI
jgi:hypothetical protein